MYQLHFVLYIIVSYEYLVYFKMFKTFKLYQNVVFKLLNVNT